MFNILYLTEISEVVWKMKYAYKYP